MAARHANSSVQKHRDALRAAGLRQIQIWVPDTSCHGFSEQCHHQSRLVAQSDTKDEGLEQMMNEALSEIDGWQE